MGGRILSDPDAGRRLVPAEPWNRRPAGPSAVKRLPSHMAKRLASGQRHGPGDDMLGGGNRAEAMDSRTAARVAADAGGDADFL